MADMQEVSPTMFHAVPRIWEKYYSGIVLKMADATWLKQKLYKVAVQIGTRYNNKALTRQKVPLHLVLAYHAHTSLSSGKLKERLGLTGYA